MCPTVCHPGHISCSGGFDANGCSIADTCVKIEDGCPAVCPIKCPPNHMSCEGGYDRNGCKMPATCVANSGKKTILTCSSGISSDKISIPFHLCYHKSFLNL